MFKVMGRVLFKHRFNFDEVPLAFIDGFNLTWENQVCNIEPHHTHLTRRVQRLFISANPGPARTRKDLQLSLCLCEETVIYVAFASYFEDKAESS